MACLVLLVLSLCLSPIATAAAASLRDMVTHALSNYPTLTIAQANRSIAALDIERARSKHYPVVDIAGNRALDGRISNSIGPRARLNLYASGAIDAEIERERWREQSLASVQDERREEIAYAVVQAYFRVIAAVRLRDAARRSLDRHLALVDDFREIARIDQGRRFDLVQARARAEQVRFQLAERDTELALAREVLARYYPEAFDPEDLVMPDDMMAPAASTPAAVAQMAEQHPRVEAAQHSLMSAQANIRVAKGNLGPRVDVEAQTGGNRYSQLTLSWPAFDLAASAARDSADAALLGARASLAEEERLVAEGQRAALAAWRTANERQRIARGQISIAEQLVDVYREQFGIGRRNLLDLLNAYTELANAEAGVETSTVQAALARHEIEYAAGRLSDFFLERRP